MSNFLLHKMADWMAGQTTAGRAQMTMKINVLLIQTQKQSSVLCITTPSLREIGLQTPEVW